MEGNKAVAYKGPGKVEVIDIDYPTFELRTGPASTRPTWAGRSRTGRSSRRSPPTSAAPTSTWSAGGPPPGEPGARATRSPARSSRSGPDVEFIKVGDICLGAVQHRLRPLPQLQGTQDRHLPERQPRPARQRLRLRRHGRLGRRPGRVRAGALRRLEPAEIPGPGPGDGEDPGPDHAFRHLPHRVPRRRDAPAWASVPRSTSPAPDRSAWPRRPARNCSAPPS